ncbi:hypothetical protein [Natrinema salaciae]|uniref:PH domain-containing protein n=1 Tax=Natrinema salaciae TaxID=1186196 RepID=A0A1H9IPF6_9EURY|nr:hypothetical protein [Natrinema salaciae]SEQ76265.1 hypothetical protein SAMN04489841_2289 [Natrinema salaciae]
MSDRRSTDPIAVDDRDAGTADTRLRLAFGGYAGALVAGLAAAVVALTDAPSTAVLGASVVAFSGGCLVGVGLTRRVRGFAVRLGRTRRRRAALVLLAAPLGLGVVASLVAPLEPRFQPVALVAFLAVAIAGALLQWLARTRYVDAVTGDDPVAVWQWEPPSSPRLDALLLATWLLLAVGSAGSGNWVQSIAWTGLAILWACSGIAEGRWRIGSRGSTPEIRVHEAGLVTQRPYARSLVPWTDVSHVRVREGELVLDRGAFDVRFDRDELPDIEAVRAEIERQLPTNGPAVSAG